MIPIPNQCLVKLDIKTMIEPKRQDLVLNELAACRKKRDKIFKMAERTYSDVITYSSLKRNSCDFKLLEQAYIEYCIINKLECPHIAEGNLKFIEETLKMAEWCEEAQEKAIERMEKLDEHNKNNSER